MTKNQLIERKFKKEIEVCRKYRCYGMSAISLLVGLKLEYGTDVDTLYNILSFLTITNRITKGKYSSKEEKRMLEQKLIKIDEYLKEYVL
ncbi:hypothetical protein [Cetobacterium sp.]|uniref:hypothetical protein n=1 Tax=Cetobacterium sp. TaxID=2071632 RepID=UPI003F2FC5D9